MSIEQLVAVAPPPQNPVFTGTRGTWQSVEEEIGIPLPTDYKQLVNIYGLGYFGGYICPLNPFLPPLPPLSLYRLQSVIADLDQSKEYLGSNKAENVPPLPVYPEDHGVLPWGVDDNRGLQCWRTYRSNQFWPLLILDYDWSEEYLTFSMSATDFLTNWLTDKISVSHYPPHPLQEPLFAPYDLSKPLGQQLWNQTTR